MAEEAGIGYEAEFHGDVESLKDDAQTTVYRICQAAVREASRSQTVRRVLVRLEVAPAGEGRAVQLQVDIEASPSGGVPFESQPLPAITDRVVAQQGSYWLEPLSPGVRHRVCFEEEPAASG